MYVMMIGFLPFTTPYTDHYKRIKLVQMMNKGLSSDHHITQMQILTQGKLNAVFHPYVNNQCFVLNLVFSLSVPP